MLPWDDLWCAVQTKCLAVMSTSAPHLSSRPFLSERAPLVGRLHPSRRTPGHRDKTIVALTTTPLGQVEKLVLETLAEKQKERAPASAGARLVQFPWSFISRAHFASRAATKSSSSAKRGSWS